MALIEILKTYTDYFIFGTLGLMSVIVLWMAFERMIFFLRVKVSDYPDIYSLESRLTSNLTIIYTIGANAPYVGLLGTVVGILITFYDMGQAGGNIEAAEIMIGLALALKATAFGIMVAIPAIIAYNLLSRNVDAKKLQWQALHAQQKQPAVSL